MFFTVLRQETEDLPHVVVLQGQQVWVTLEEAEGCWRGDCPSVAEDDTEGEM